VNELAEELLRSVEATAAWLKRLNDTLVRAKLNKDTWSIQEITGHLVDSAANNHQRFVRAQYGDALVFPGYDQDEWVAAQSYQTAPWPELIEFWLIYNRHLARVMRSTPQERWDVECRIGSNDPVTLRYLMEDYVRHLEHHIQQMRERAALSIQHRDMD
jgi:hypothetical protein